MVGEAVFGRLRRRGRHEGAHGLCAVARHDLRRVERGELRSVRVERVRQLEKSSMNKLRQQLLGNAAA